MDNLSPEQYTAIIALIKQVLGNPFAIAVIISHGLELTDYFRDETAPASRKFAIVAAACTVAAVAWTALATPDGLEPTKAALFNLIVLAIAMTLSTQIAHAIISKASPALAALFTPKTTSQISVTTGGTSATATTVQPSAEAAATPTLAAAANAVNVAAPDPVATTPDALTVQALINGLKAAKVQLVPVSPSSGYAPDALRSTPLPNSLSPVPDYKDEPNLSTNPPFADDVSAKG